MGKKFVTVTLQQKKIRLYSQDILNVFQKKIRKVPCIPRFEESFKPYYEDT